MAPACVPSADTPAQPEPGFADSFSFEGPPLVISRVIRILNWVISPLATVSLVRGPLLIALRGAGGGGGGGGGGKQCGFRASDMTLFHPKTLNTTRDSLYLHVTVLDLLIQG